MGEVGVLTEIQKAVKKTVGMKKVRQLISVAQESIGVRYGLAAAKMRLEPVHITAQYPSFGEFCAMLRKIFLK